MMSRPTLDVALATEAASLAAAHQLDASNSTRIAPSAAIALQPAVRRLLAGRSVRLFVVGGSASAGAGGIGVNHTFDARLAAKLNAVLERVETSSRRPLGRVIRTSVAQGGTTSFWAGLMAGALHGQAPHILAWEYSINDHAVALEASSRAPSTVRRKFTDDTMRYMLDYWLRRSLDLSADGVGSSGATGGAVSSPPLLLLTYLWDKQPAMAFKPGNRALCRRMPVPGSAYAAQRPVIEQFISSGAGIAALDMATYISRTRPGQFCPLVADSYFHPSHEGHELAADLLTLMLARLLRQAASVSTALTAAETASLPPLRSLPRVSSSVSALQPTASAPPASAADSVSARLESLFADRQVRPTVALAWEPKRRSDHAFRVAGRPHFTHAFPPTRLFAKSVKERADRKWMWLVPPCKRGDNSSSLSIWLPRGHAGGPHAISFFAMESPGARIRHTLNGRPLEFEAVQGSFLAQSWGYLQRWHVLDASGARPSVSEPMPASGGGDRMNNLRRGSAGGSAAAMGNGAHEWRMCAEHVPNARCIGFRCGLEFKMPMRTAAVGWILTLTDTRWPQ